MSELYVEWENQCECYLCKKEFYFIGRRTDYVYKRYYKSKLMWFCSYSCMSAFDKKEDERKRLAKASKNRGERDVV